MRVRVGCELIYNSLYPTPMIIMVRPRDWHGHRMIDERRTITPETVPVHEFVDHFGNYVWRVVTPVGRFEVRYDAVAEVPPTPDPVFAGLPKTPVEYLPDEVLMYTLPSRHCQADLFIDDAWKMFGDIPTGWEQVQAVCDWLHTNITYGKGSTSNTSGFEAYNQRRGISRRAMCAVICRTSMSSLIQLRWISTPGLRLIWTERGALLTHDITGNEPAE